MAQVLPADAFPGRRRSGSGAAVAGPGDARYTLETAYGYRLDLGFLGYVEAIEQGLTLRRVPVKRRLHRASWAGGGGREPEPRSRPRAAGGGGPEEEALRGVREQMAAALGRLRELEEQVRALPALRSRLERLQEEKRQLLERLRSHRGCGCGHGDAAQDGDGGGTGGIAGTGIGSGVTGIDPGITGVGSGITGIDPGTTGAIPDTGISPGSIRSPGQALAPPRGRRSVAVGTDGAAVLPGRVAELEQRLRRALEELREARARLGQQPPRDADGAEGDGDPPRGGSSSSSDDSEYHEAEQGHPQAPAVPPRDVA